MRALCVKFCVKIVVYTASRIFFALAFIVNESNQFFMVPLFKNMMSAKRQANFNEQKRDCSKLTYAEMNHTSAFLYSGCDGGVVCLEKGGGVLRDTNNRPIVLSFGMIYGSVEDMTKQVTYVMNRSSDHNACETGICAVIEGNYKSFRVPEYRMKIIFDLLRFKYKEHMHNGVIHFINLSFVHRMGIKFVVRMLPTFLRSLIVVHTSMESFLKHMPDSSQLQRWGGSVQFDVDAYVAERCKVEGLEKSVSKNTIQMSQLLESKTMLASLTSYTNLHMCKKSSHGIWKRKYLTLSSEKMFVFNSNQFSFQHYKYCFDLRKVCAQFEDHVHEFTVDDGIRIHHFKADNASDYSTIQTYLCSFESPHLPNH